MPPGMASQQVKSRPVLSPPTIPTWTATALLVAVLPGQDVDTQTAAWNARAACIAETIDSWMSDQGRTGFKLESQVRAEPASRYEYVRIAVRGRILRPHGERRTHLSLLHAVIGKAEMHPGKVVADGLLRVASLGYDADYYSPRLTMVRDLGHFALMRMEEPEVWSYLLRIALGPQKDGDFEFDPPSVEHRIAAVRLLGMQQRAVFRIAVERCLLEEDSRLRLAAAEALGLMNQVQTLPVLTRAVVTEKHPIVAQALVDAIDRTLRKHGAVVDEEERLRALRGCLRMVRRLGWRNDLAIAYLFRKHPLKAAIPALIAVMRGAKEEQDPILKVINKNASPILSHEAWVTVQQLTGALLPEDATKWEEFWELEKGNIVVSQGPVRGSSGNRTSSQGFYGVPVLGQNVVFVIDTSGSMKARVPATTGEGPGSRDKAMSRLDAAKSQVLNAVQGMDKESHYRLLTFPDDITLWSRKPVRPGRNSDRTLTNALGRIMPHGSTNLFAALKFVLNVDGAAYGSAVESEVDEVFILSDGEPSSGEIANTYDILVVVEELNRYRKIRINTVYTGTGSLEFMRNLAEQNYGVFVHR